MNNNCLSDYLYFFIKIMKTIEDINLRPENTIYSITLKVLIDTKVNFYVYLPNLN